MARPLDTSTDEPKDEFRLQKPASSRASTLGISTALPRLHQPQSTLQRAHTVTQSGLAKRTDRRLADRPRRQRSLLLRMKGSNEGLSTRSPVHETTPSGLRDNNFAVGNVGNNGKLYLRPLVEPGSRRHHGKSLPRVTLPAPASSTKLPPPRASAGPDPRQSIWSSSQFSELRPSYAREEIEEANDHVSDSEPPHRRAHSFSTISEYEQSAASDGGDEFRIVIDRFDTNKPTSEPIDGLPMPALEVPIPHYRLGTLQLSTEGTPVLRSSIYTHTSHTSVSDNTHSSIYLKDNTGGSGQNRVPSTYDSPGLTPPEGTLSMAMSLFSAVTPSAAKDRHSNSTQRSGIYILRHPLEPSIFDILAKNIDDSAVVKYIPNTRDISAATPARIIVQISSESFMDYELVSDFFLTFRSYLSTTSLLGLLLARLEWAINRLQADGRIIRIRTFAALRHWILNYFVDDFVGNRDLRVQFCHKINTMYADVKARSTTEVSDAKILVDLKRCWHGRCMMYWDSPPFTSPDNPALPGDGFKDQGFNNNRSSEVGSSSQEAVATGHLSIQSLVQSTNSIKAERIPNGHMSHARTISSGTSQSVPGSSSEQSVQALSCSLPGKSIRASMSMGGCLDAPHPVVVSIKPSPRPPTSSATSNPPAHVHKRSGSFSDSIRDDRAPLSRTLGERYEQEQALLPTSDGGNGSLIRGNFFPPVDASVAAFVPPSPTTFQAPDELRENHARSASEGNIRTLGTSPALKTVIGSIRRALHTRNLGANTAPHVGSPTYRSPRVKTATLPLNVALKSEMHKDRKAFLKPNTPLRTDHICEKSMRDYREAIGLNPPQSSPSFTIKRPGVLDDQTSHLRAQKLRHQRLVSDVTMGSKSIVIVDDTGLDLPVVSGGNNWLDYGHKNNPSSTSTTGRDSHLSSGTGVVPVAASLEVFGHEVEDLAPPFSDRASQHPLKSPAPEKTRSISSRLRKYASFQSGISRSLDAPSEAGSWGGKQPLGRLLRRRPGGDLRKIQNVHDLATDLRPQSFATDTSLTESLASSARNYFRRSFSRFSQARIQSTPPRFDLINTHSSQHLRPSFEAAIAGFSRIPDDADGGIESTLLKLEGKWPSLTGSDSHPEGGRLRDPELPQNYSDRGYSESSWAGTSHLDTYPMTLGEKVVTSSFQGLSAQSHTDSVVESEFSYNSIPLLERGLSDDSMKKPLSTMHPSATPHRLLPQNPSSSNLTNSIDFSPQSLQLFDEPMAGRQELNIQRTFDSPSIVHGDRDSESEISSEISIDLIEKDEALERSSSTNSLATQSLEMPPHPLAHPPSPPITIQRAVTTSPCREEVAVIRSQKPLTPGSSPTRLVDRKRVAYVRDENTGVGNRIPELHIEVPKMPDHVPFILAYDSRLLAQQFTVVEKSALDEVDWKDLVDMKWNNNSPSIVSWVHFLAEKERKGIDLVVGRFNLMVKWILSEIVLTRDIQERAWAIAKFIHIAAHSRQMCNYSTMLQIAIALSSVDCTRLQRTWALVSSNDRRLLDDMESLIQPLRNFHELRVEMETTNLQNGCIPFVGLYVHDLTYNAQKPSQIPGTRGGDALVNFERYRTSARIVKCLLRLIDASNKYSLEPVPGVVEKCLWIGSLPEDQVQAFSKNLE
ncbi:hypothetical protein UA08_01168 [Talaromyces atroroseus]|uniref:Guanine nucleotide exchange factor LTE1 n=1 Tax=Talaromyces atroroseus TaxID=1441469 RepID=A0A1Q5QBG4_TALAT|nr:hypothetical protein UA08_01168 [Talaromyces atroroseus]OKL63158.1 hypothetical protein UA08_01168 [Talaromyces atroroseus]